MKEIAIKNIKEKIKVYGRSYYDSREDVLYSNFTCGAWEFLFTGKDLQCDFEVLPGLDDGQELPKNGSPRDLVSVAVFLDNEEETPYKRFVLCETQARESIYRSDAVETHRIKIVKLSENNRSGLGIRGFYTDGEIGDVRAEKRDIIEFIGDSITCGFGNESKCPESEFAIAEENGWMTYGAITSRKLKLEARYICVSGISVRNIPIPNFPQLYDMNDIYEYTDRIHEDRLAKKRNETVKEYTLYDFREQPAKYIVLNLGTNDAAMIDFSEDSRAAEEKFLGNYLDFVRKIRALNGPDAIIICSLGSIDYYLIDHIHEAVRILNNEGDRNVHLFKYHRMMHVAPDAGAAFHPAVQRQKIMADELVEFIREISEFPLP